MLPSSKPPNSVPGETRDHGFSRGKSKSVVSAWLPQLCRILPQSPSLFSPIQNTRDCTAEQSGAAGSRERGGTYRKWNLECNEGRWFVLLHRLQEAHPSTPDASSVGPPTSPRVPPALCGPLPAPCTPHRRLCQPCPRTRRQMAQLCQDGSLGKGA